MVIDTDDEEERKLLLSESVTSSPVNIKASKEDQGIRRHLLEESLGPKRGLLESLTPRLAWTSSSMGDNDKLRIGPAEEQFLVMTGAAEEEEAEDETDGDIQVPDSLQVVSNILSDLDKDMVSDKVDGCSCQSQPHHKLVVDVHQVSGLSGSSNILAAAAGHKCSKHSKESKHTADRLQARCHSQESDRHSQRQTKDQLDNCDRIETVGEDRCRHMSESALGPFPWSLGRRKRAATLCSSPRSNAETRQQNRHSSVYDGDRGYGDTATNNSCVNQCRSYDTLGASDVKFDIWEETESEAVDGMKSGEGCDDDLKTGVVNDNYDGPTRGHDDAGNDEDPDKSDLESSFFYSQHPLVTEMYSGYTGSRPLGCMSHSSSTNSMPICRICQLPSMEPHNTLISPCRCLGSIRYVHNPCLAKWLEVCSKKTGEAPVCELCQYQYIRHKKFVISNWRVPSITSKDKILHFVFLMSIFIMIICSVATILSFKQADTLPKVGPDTELSSSELLTLSCGVLFFFSFFVAMYVEVKAEFTIYQLICKFFQMNHEWTILEYDKARDRVKRESGLC